MSKIKFLSTVWYIRHKATLVNYLIAFVSLEEEVFVLMKRKDTYNAVKTIKGSFYIRESNTETFKRLSEYYLWDMKMDREELKQFQSVENIPFIFSDKEYNGWKMFIPTKEPTNKPAPSVELECVDF